MRLSLDILLIFRRVALAALTVICMSISACTLVVPAPDIMIGTGKPSGTLYPLGGSICRLFNLNAETNGKRCAARPSDGPIANVNALRDGLIDVGILQSDVLVDAVAGTGEFAADGKHSELRTLFAGHADAFTLVARRELGITRAAELRGTRINMGAPAPASDLP